MVFLSLDWQGHYTWGSNHTCETTSRTGKRARRTKQESMYRISVIHSEIQPHNNWERHPIKYCNELWWLP